MKKAETMKPMTKASLITAISEVAGLSKADSTRALEGMLQSIQTELMKGNEVNITGFGAFGITQREAREGRNPRTGEALKIPAKKLPKFRAGKTLREAIA